MFRFRESEISTKSSLENCLSFINYISKMKLNNLINKMIFDIEFSSKADHAAFTQDLELDKELLMDLIGDILNQVDTDVSIDQLTLKLPEQGLSNYKQVREFIQESIREELINAKGTPAPFNIIEALQQYNKTGLKPWWLDRHIGLKKRISSLTSINQVDLIKIVEQVLINRDHLKRFKNSVSQKIYKEVFERILKSKQQTFFKSFFTDINTADYLSSYDRFTMEYLLIKKSILPKKDFTLHDARLISNLPYHLSHRVKSYLKQFTNTDDQISITDQSVGFDKAPHQQFKDPITIFISYLENGNLHHLIDLIVLEHQLTSLSPKDHKHLIKKIINHKNALENNVVHRLMVFSPIFIHDLLCSLIEALHSKATAVIFTFFINHNKVFKRPQNIQYFLEYLIRQKSIKDGTLIYDFIIELFTNSVQRNQFFSSFSEQGKSTEVYLKFKNRLVQKLLNPTTGKITKKKYEPISKSLSDYLTENANLEYILESLGYLDPRKRELINSIEPWSPGDSQSLPKFLKRLGLDKNQAIDVSYQLWYDVSNKRTITKRDQRILSELSKLLLEQSTIIKHREKATKIINEVISNEINRSSTLQVRELLSSQTSIINYIDDSSFVKILSFLNPGNNFVIIYNRIQEVILKSGQSHLLNSLRSHSIYLITTYGAYYTAKKYTEELLDHLVKNNTSNRKKFISSLTSNTSTIDHLIAYKNNRFLSALFTLDSSKRAQILDRDWVDVKEVLVDDNQLKDTLSINTKSGNSSLVKDSDKIPYDELDKIWSRFELNRDNSSTYNRNTQDILKEIKSVLRDKLNDKETKALLKYIKQSVSEKNIRSLLDFINTSNKGTVPYEIPSNSAFKPLDKKDLNTLQLKISSDHNAVNQLRLLLQELLKNERELILNEQSLELSDRLEYLIQLSATSETEDNELVTVFDPISTDHIKAIVKKAPNTAYDLEKLTAVSNKILQEQIDDISLEYNLKVSELWKEFLFNSAFAKSNKQKSNADLNIKSFLKELNERSLSKLTDYTKTIDGILEETRSIEAKIIQKIEKNTKVFLEKKTQRILKNIKQLVDFEINTLESDSNPIVVAAAMSFSTKDIKGLFASIKISNEKRVEFINKLNDFTKNISEEIEQQFKDILSLRLGSSLQTTSQQQTEINERFTSLNVSILESQISPLINDLKQEIPVNQKRQVIKKLLGLINEKKVSIVRKKRSLFASKIAIYFNTETNINEIFNGTNGISHNKEFQEKITSLELEKEYGATQAIKLKNFLKKLILERRATILELEKNRLTLQTETALKEAEDTDLAELKNVLDFNIQITKEEKNLLAIKDVQKSKEFVSQINLILKQEQEFIQQELKEIYDRRLQRLIHKAQTIDSIKSPLMNIENILSSKKSLLSFVRKYENNVEVMTLFAKVSLQSAHNNQTQKTFDTIIKSLSKLEKVIRDLNTKIGMSNMSELILEQFVRVELLKSLNLPGISTKVIAFNIVEKLKSSNLLQPLTEKLTNYKPKNLIERQVVTGIKLYLEEDDYNFIDRKIENEFYFNDLFFHLLAYKKLPFWAKNASYEVEDAIKYFSSKIINKNADYVTSWLESKTIKKTITAHFLKQPIDVQIAFIEAVELNRTSRPLSNMFKGVLLKATELQININKVFEEIIEKDIYKSSNSIDILEKIIGIISHEDTDVREVLINHFKSIQIPVASQINIDLDKELDTLTLTGYYIVDKTLPRKLKNDSKQVLIKLSSSLKNNPNYIIDVLKKEVINESSLRNLMSLLDKKDLIQSIEIEQKSLTIELQLLLKSVLKELKSQEKNSSKFISYLNVIVYLLKVQGSLKRSSLKEFYRLVDLIDPSSWDKVQNTLLKLLDKENDKNRSRFLDKNTFNIQSLISSKTEKTKDPWEKTIEYYINYGSLPKNNQEVTLLELSSNLERFLSSDILTWKVKIHRWAKRKNKIAHLLSLYEDDQKGFLFTAIHPNLKRDLSIVIDAVNGLENYGVSFQKPFKIVDDILHEVMNIWSSTFINSSKSDFIIGSFLYRNLKVSTVKDDKIKDVIEVMIKKSTVQKTNILLKIKADIFNKIKIKEEVVQQVKKDTPVNSKQGIAISNSGLILAWPFIATLFNKIGLLEKNKFIDDHSQQKAVLLTQYLTNFSTDFEESDLALNKLLCGLKISDFVDVSIELSDYEKETAAFLLNAIIQNWEKLNKTSITTLQETFLQREGILESFEKDYKLHVSSKAFDLLLKTIPWNISMIQTTFMEIRILVEWNY